MGKKKTGCAYVDCIKPDDPDCNNGLCVDHLSEWRRSTEFAEALKDDNVIAYMQLGLAKKAMHIVNKRYKAKWLKRMIDEKEA